MVSCAITWNPSPIIFSVGSFDLLWYGVLFASGLLLAGWYVWRRFQEAGITEKEFELLLVLSFFGIFIGARLCHCLFYEPEYFLQRPIEMLLPVAKNAEGGYYFSGYHGLASHGGAVGLICAILLFKWRSKTAVLPIMDYIAIATPLAGGFIRLGNLMNSEIVGSPTNLPWAFVFTQIDQLPRHPAQLYEAIFYLLLFVVMALIFKKIGYQSVKNGFYLAMVIISIALFRFLIEYAKEVQVGFERDMTLNMGQWLSIPFFIAGMAILLYTQLVHINDKKE